MVLMLLLQVKGEAPYVEATAALSFALEHSALSSSPRVLCAAACSCNAWREAVQQCQACNTEVVLDLRSALPQFESFSIWLRTHALLGRSIELEAVEAEEEQSDLHYHGQPRQEHLKAALLLLQQALEAAAVGTDAAAAAAAAAGTAAATATINAACCKQQQQQQQQLQRTGVRLAGFSCGYPASASLLAALPAHSLNHLALHLQNSSPSSSAALSAALARLTALQLLQLHARYAAHAAYPGRFEG
jgi:hypothetical protein